MDFTLPDAATVRDAVRAVAAKYAHTDWSRCEDEHRFPAAAWRDLADGGWIGLSVPEEYGGGGQGVLELAIACETLAASGGRAGIFLYILTPGFGAMTLGPAPHGGTATGDPARGRRRQRPVLPGADRARRGQQRPGDHHVGPPGRRRLPHPRAESVDLRGGERRLDDRGNPHRPGRRGEAEDRRVHPVPGRRHGGPGQRPADLHPDPQARRQRGHQQLGLLRRRAGACGERAGHGGRPVPGAVGRAEPERILAAAGGVGAAEAALTLACDYARQVVEEFVLAHIGTQVLGLPRSY